VQPGKIFLDILYLKQEQLRQELQHSKGVASREQVVYQTKVALRKNKPIYLSFFLAAQRKEHDNSYRWY
jgi:type III secretory pathway lipoprotein EscJ